MKDHKLAAIEIKIKDLEKRIQILENRVQLNPAGVKKNNVKKEISIKEFMISKSPNDDPQRTLAIGYFFEKFRNMTCFNAADLEQGFRDAKIKPPQNINDKVNRNISKGYMMETEEKKDSRKAWVLTNTGELLVETAFKEK